MKPAMRFACGCGTALLLALAGYWLALAEPLQALAQETRSGEQLRETVDEAKRIARQQERLAMANQQLRRATGANAVDSAPQSSATNLAEASRRIVAAGGAIAGIYPQPNQGCGFRVIAPASQAIDVVREVERNLAWRLARLEMKKADDGRMELYLLLEFGR